MEAVIPIHIPIHRAVAGWEQGINVGMRFVPNNLVDACPSLVVPSALHVFVGAATRDEQWCC